MRPRGWRRLWLHPLPVACSRATVTSVSDGFSLTTPAHAHDVQLKSIFRRSWRWSHGSRYNCFFCTGRGLCQPPCVAYCMSHSMMETGNTNFAGFPELSFLVKSKGYIAVGRCAHVAGSAYQAHPAIVTMRRRPLIRSPAQISSPDVGQRQSRLVLREYSRLYLPGTSFFLSCDQTNLPCRLSPPDIRRCFDAAVRMGKEGRPAGKLVSCLVFDLTGAFDSRFALKFTWILRR